MATGSLERSQSHFMALDIEETGNTIEKLSKTANICAKEMEANPNAREF